MTTQPSRKNGLKVTAIVSMGMCGAMACYFFYVKHRTKIEKLESSCKFLPRDPHYKVDVKLVRYHDCVLFKDMVTSGLIQDIENFEAKEEDVFVVSYPKSGTTWLQEVVFQLHLIKASKEPNESILPIVSLSNEPMEVRFPYLEFVYPGLEDISKRKGVRLIKTHLPIHLLPNKVFKNGSKILYIYRNPKDVAVSYYHFARMLVYTSYSGTLEQFCHSFKQDEGQC